MFAVSDPSAATTTPFETLGESLLSQGSDDDVDNGGLFVGLLQSMSDRAAEQLPTPQGEAASLGLSHGARPSASPPLTESAEPVDAGPRSATSDTEGDPSALPPAQILPQGLPLLPLDGDPSASSTTPQGASALPPASTLPGVASEREPLAEPAPPGDPLRLPAPLVPSVVRSEDNPAVPSAAQEEPSLSPAAPASRLVPSGAEGRPPAPAVAPVIPETAGETSAVPVPPLEVLSSTWVPGFVAPLPSPGGPVAEGAPDPDQAHAGASQEFPTQPAAFRAPQQTADADHRGDPRAPVRVARFDFPSGFETPGSATVDRSVAAARAHPETVPIDEERWARGAAGDDQGQRTGRRTPLLTAAKAYALGQSAGGDPGPTDSAASVPTTATATESSSPTDLFQPRQDATPQRLADSGARESDGAKLPSDVSHLADARPIDTRQVTAPMSEAGEAPGRGTHAESTPTQRGFFTSHAELPAEPVTPGIRREGLATLAAPVAEHDPSGRLFSTKHVENEALADVQLQDVEDRVPGRVVPSRPDADGGQPALPYWRARAFSQAFHGGDPPQERSPVTDVQAESAPQPVRAAALASSPVDMMATPSMPSGSSSVAVVVPPTEVVMGPTYIADSSLADNGIGKQIVQAARLQWRDGVADARVSLRPGYLGDVTISLRVENGGIEAVLHVDEPEVRAWVKANHVLLKEALAERGLTLERLVVSEEHPGGRNRRDGREPDREQRRHRQSWTNSGHDPVFEVVV